MIKIPHYVTERNLINMTNAVLGISILTMPYCFGLCGIILGLVAMAVSGFMTSFSCKLLMKISQMNKTNNLEFLAFKAFGIVGKVLLELSVILLLFGNLVTYQQTLNYSLPNMLANLVGKEHSSVTGPMYMFFIAVFVTLPLSLFRKIDHLNKINALSLLFYIFFTVYLIIESITILYESSLAHEIKLWNFGGLFKCFPIFSIAFSVQQVMFHLYEELPSSDKEGMSILLDIALTIAFFIYSSVGVFGYIAFNSLEISGSFIRMLPSNLAGCLILIGLNIAVLSGYPYMIFPCRHSLNTLLSTNILHQADHDSSDRHIPENRFIFLSVFLVGTVALTAALVPNIAFVLSLTGATTGVISCFIWPSVLYLATYCEKATKTNLKVKLFLIVGILMFVVCTIATFEQYAPTEDINVESSSHKSVTKRTMMADIEEVIHSNNVKSVHSLNMEPVRVEPPNPDDFDDLDKSKILQAIEKANENDLEINSRQKRRVSTLANNIIKILTNNTI